MGPSPLLAQSVKLCSWACRQYVQQFFKCSECSQHFEAMAAEDAAALVTTRRDAVLWSWRAHNIVRSY